MDEVMNETKILEQYIWQMVWNWIYN